MFTITAGSSEAAIKESASCIRLMPGLDEEVMARSPTAAAPYTMLMAAISLSACMKVPPSSGSLRDMNSGISFCGVMG